MPIYEFYSPDTNKVYTFYAKTLAQGKTVPKCPDNPRARMQKVVSSFAVTGRAKSASPGSAAETSQESNPPDDARMEAAMSAMEHEFSHVDENDPKAMARMMRRMSELTGEKLDAPMEEAVRKLEEGVDPESLESELGDLGGDESGGPGESAVADAGPAQEPKARLKVRRPPPVRDPTLYDYE